MQQFSSIMLSLVTKAYVDASRRLRDCSGQGGEKFGLGDIGVRAFGPNGNAVLSRLRSGTVALRNDTAECILTASHELLKRQVKQAAGRYTLQALEREIAQSLGFKGDRPSVEQLLPDDRLYTARTVEDLGFDDLVEWNFLKNWQGAHTELARQRAVAYLNQLRTVVNCAQSDERRLDYAHMGIALATHLHPGTVAHEIAYDLANDIAARCELFRVSESRRVDPALRERALRLRMQLRWIRVAPHLSSPTNYLPHLLQGKLLCDTVRERIAEPMADIRRLTRLRLELMPRCGRTLIDASSTESFEARMLACTEGSAALRRADMIHDVAVQHSAQVQEPYGLLYPILRELVRNKPKAAAGACQCAVATFEAKGAGSAQAAFSGLLLHLTALNGGAATQDSRVRESAQQAVESEQISFMFSHVFDRAAVKCILAAKDPKRLAKHRWNRIT